jgi:hypothetical protein
MTARARPEDEENEKTAQASTRHLEKLASAAAAADWALQWRAPRIAYKISGRLGSAKPQS